MHYCCCICVQGNFCIYKISDEDDETSVFASTERLMITDDPATEEAEADAVKEEEYNKKLKLSVGLPSHYPIEVKVMVYVVRVRLHYV